MKKILLLFFIILNCPAFANGGVEESNDDQKIPYKVIGRGFYNKETQMRLQMACVGDFINPHTSDEELTYDHFDRKCDHLQFVVTDEDGNQILVGPKFLVSDENTASIKEQLKSQFAVSRVSRDMTRQRKWAMTRDVYGERSKQIGPTAQGLMFVGTALAVTKLTALFKAAGLHPLLGFGTVTVGIFLAPLAFDVATLPITFVLDLVEGNNSLGVKARSIEVLQDRAKFSWQFKPHAMSNDKFAYLLRQLTNGCKSSSYSNYHHGQLVLLPKKSSMGYEFVGDYGILKSYWVPGEWQVKPLLKVDRKNNNSSGDYPWPTFTESELNSMKPRCDEFVGEQRLVDEK